MLENLNGSLCLNRKLSLMLNVPSELTNNNTSRQYFTHTHGFHEPQKQPAVDKWQQQKYKMSAHVCRREVGEVWGLWGFGELLWLLFCSFTTTCKHRVLESAVTLPLKTHGCCLCSTELYTVFCPTPQVSLSILEYICDFIWENKKSSPEFSHKLKNIHIIFHLLPVRFPAEGCSTQHPKQ